MGAIRCAIRRVGVGGRGGEGWGGVRWGVYGRGFFFFGGGGVRIVTRRGWGWSGVVVCNTTCGSGWWGGEVGG